LIESQANLSQIREAQAERAESQLHFSMAEKKHSEERYLEVLNWLSAPDTVLDQEAAATIRKEHPSTGMFIIPCDFAHSKRAEMMCLEFFLQTRILPQDIHESHIANELGRIVATSGKANEMLD
jgi:hypothetical protein